MSGSVATGATRVVGMPTRSRCYPEGRVWSHPGCLTRLSTYNRASTCFMHSPRVAPRLRGRTSGGLRPAAAMSPASKSSGEPDRGQPDEKREIGDLKGALTCA
jgi:hypothetical protein